MIKKTLICFSLLLAVGAAAAQADKMPTYKVKRQEIEKMDRSLQDTYAGMQYLMNGYQKRQFFNLESDALRLQWIDKFWSQRDPTPTSEDNPMRVEHEIRVRLAREFFHSRKWPGWDKRGEAFVRYGPPDVRGSIPADITSKEFIPARELWFYRKHYMIVSYQNFGTTNEYIYSIDPLGLSEEISPELMEFLIYDTEHAISGKIPLDMRQNMLAAPVGQIDDANLLNALMDPSRERQYQTHKPREINDEIDAPLRPEAPDELSAALLPTDLQFVFNKDEIQEIANNFEITIEETPASYPFNFEENDLPFYFGVDQFRGGASSNRVDVSLEVPVIVENEGSTGFEETFHAEVVVWDPDYNEVARKKREIVLRTDADVASFTNLLPTQLVLSLDRGYYRMAVSVRGENSGRESSYKTAFSCEPFEGLALSDIMFARKISPAGRPSIFMRGAMEVVPHPFRHYGRTFAIPIYFEIYNLQLSTQGATSYTVEYKITPHASNKKGFFARFDEADPIVSSRFQSSGFGEMEVQHLSINTTNLEQGSYDLLITITDDLAGVVAFSRGTFSLLE